MDETTEILKAIKGLSDKIHSLDLRIESVNSNNEHYKKEVKIMMAMLTEVQKKQNDTIFGNGKDGLVTRATLLEDNIEGLEFGYRKVKDTAVKDYKDLAEKIVKISEKVVFNLGKQTKLASIVSIIVGMTNSAVLEKRTDG